LGTGSTFSRQFSRPTAGPIFTKQSDGSWSASLIIATENERHFLHRLNELYFAGLLDEEGFVHSDELYVAKLASGRVVMNDGNYYYPSRDPEIEGFRYQSLEPDIEYMEAYGVDASGEVDEPTDTPSYGTPWTMSIPEGDAAVQKQL
jgi:hypothetical protein